MNPLTLVKRIQNINAKEASLGISEEASWHAKYKDSAYVFVGGIPFDLTEGDLLAVFAQYGEIVDVNLVRDKGTGKSKGFAFIAYEDQRSTNLAVDNLNGAQILGRIIRVDHVTKYKKKEEEDEEAERQKREARGVCRAFQRGECTRGAGCKFSHDELRAANTGWGPDHKSSRWGNDKFEGPPTSEKRSVGEKPSGSLPKQYERLEEKKSMGHNDTEFDPKSREDYVRRVEKRSRRHEDDEFVPKSREDCYTRDEKRSRRYEDDGFVKKMRDNDYKRDEKKSRRYEDDEVEPKDYDYKKEEKRSRRNEGVKYEPRSKDVDYTREDNASRRHNEDDGSKSKLKDTERTRRYDGDDLESRTKRHDDRKEDKSFRRHDSESPREDQEKRGRDSGHGRDTSSHRYKEKR